MGETVKGMTSRRNWEAPKRSLGYLVIRRGRPSVVSYLSAKNWSFPTGVGLIIVDDETVAWEEGELGILAQGTADQE